MSSANRVLLLSSQSCFCFIFALLSRLDTMLNRSGKGGHCYSPYFLSGKTWHKFSPVLLKHQCGEYITSPQNCLKESLQTVKAKRGLRRYDD